MLWSTIIHVDACLSCDSTPPPRVASEAQEACVSSLFSMLSLRCEKVVDDNLLQGIAFRAEGKLATDQPHWSVGRAQHLLSTLSSFPTHPSAPCARMEWKKPGFFQCSISTTILKWINTGPWSTLQRREINLPEKSAYAPVPQSNLIASDYFGRRS
jgi:hypothetical protein